MLFFVVSMVDGFLHPNYSAISEPISNLGAKAPNAWIQNVNFFLSGLLLVVFAIGFFWELRLVTKSWWVIISTFFLLLTGICLALASIFPTDIPGYPPVTFHGRIHDIIFFVVFGTLLIAILVCGLNLRKIPGGYGYGWYSIIQAIVMVLLFVFLATVTVSGGGLMGFFQRIFVKCSGNNRSMAMPNISLNNKEPRDDRRAAAADRHFVERHVYLHATPSLAGSSAASAHLR